MRRILESFVYPHFSQEIEPTTDRRHKPFHRVWNYYSWLSINKENIVVCPNNKKETRAAHDFAKSEEGKGVGTKCKRIQRTILFTIPREEFPRLQQVLYHKHFHDAGNPPRGHKFYEHRDI
jgi:hypothetical protein